MSGRRPAWWARRGGLASLWSPLASVFSAVSGGRRWAYRRGLIRVERLPVPVVVVGNIAVGGSGKTPVVAWLVAHLKRAGWHPAVLSRGYGGTVRGPAILPDEASASYYGDEPVLLRESCGCPVVVGADRVAAGRFLLERHPECDVLVSDDGLQHYRLARNLEIVVVDEAVLGNRHLLPAGPLREPVSRLASAGMLLWHGPVSASLRERAGRVPGWSMELIGDELVTLDGSRRTALAEWRGRAVHAVAAIGRPERFFRQLEAAGLQVIRHAFPDHHRFSADDLSFAPVAPQIMTGKDAVKCRSFALADAWYLPVTARIPATAADFILETLRHGSSLA